MTEQNNSPIIPDPMMELIKLNDADIAEPIVFPVFGAAINAVPSSSLSWDSSETSSNSNNLTIQEQCNKKTIEIT